MQGERQSVWVVLSNPVMLVSEVLGGLHFLHSLEFGLPNRVCVSSNLLLVTYQDP